MLAYRLLEDGELSISVDKGTEGDGRTLRDGKVPECALALWEPCDQGGSRPGRRAQPDLSPAASR
jgi:hypothetical protein